MDWLAEVSKMFRLPVRDNGNRESGVSPTIELLIYVPLGLMFVGFILNSAFHWTTYFYMQGVVNEAATYTAAAGGNQLIPYVPDGGFNKKPTEYIAKQASESRFVTSIADNRCFMVGGKAGVNGIARCTVTYKTLVFPTDPLTWRFFGQDMKIVAEDLAQTACNPNIDCP
jgi:hypothetical protein